MNLRFAKTAVSLITRKNDFRLMPPMHYFKKSTPYCSLIDKEVKICDFEKMLMLILFRVLFQKFCRVIRSILQFLE